MNLIIDKKENETNVKKRKDSFSEIINHKSNFNVLPCEGIYKLSSETDNITYSFCDSDYWNCPNKKCIMHLV